MDCHAHLDTLLDLDACIRAASVAGVDTIVGVSTTIETSRCTLLLAAGYPGVIPSIGIHPCSVPCGADEDQLVQELQCLLDKHPHVRSLGEIGLDRSPAADGTRYEDQRRLFAAQLLLARERSLVANIHSRQAGHYALDMLIQSGVHGAILHAFDGRAKYAVDAAQRGYRLSVPPSAHRSPSMQKWIRRLPLDALLLESDAPALAKVKGAQSAPADIIESAALVAQLMDKETAVVLAQTRQQGLHLFGLE